MPRKLKYTPEQIREFLDYAKKNKIGILNTLQHFSVNRRTFYMSAHRYGMTTDSGRKWGWRTVAGISQGHLRAMNKEQVGQILKHAEANRVSHRKACSHFGYSYNTFRGAIVRLKVEAKRFSSTYSKEDVEKVFGYAAANHISLTKACNHFAYKYSLINPSAKRYGLKLEKEIPVFDEAKQLSDKEFVHFYMAKGYVANEIYHVLSKYGRKIARGMVYYFYKEQSKDRVQAKIDKLNERLGQLKSSQLAKV